MLVGGVFKVNGSRVLDHAAIAVGFALAIAASCLLFAKAQPAWADEGAIDVAADAAAQVEVVSDAVLDSSVDSDAVEAEESQDAAEAVVPAVEEPTDGANGQAEADEQMVETGSDENAAVESGSAAEEDEKATAVKPESKTEIVPANVAKPAAKQAGETSKVASSADEAITTQAAQTIADGAYAIKTASTYGQALSNNGSYSANAAIKSYNVDGSYDQLFYFQHVRDGLYSIFSIHSGLALTVSSGKIVQASYAGSAAQLFEVRATGAYHALISKSGAITATASSDAKAQGYTGAASQKFRLIEGPMVLPGVQVYRSAASTGNAIRAKGGSSDKGAAAQAASYSNDGSYNLLVQRNGSQYAVRPVSSGYYLAPSGSNVVQNAKAYNWDVQYSKSGTRRGLMLVNPAGTQAATVSGNNVVMTGFAYKPAEAFLPAKSALLSNGYFKIVASNGKLIDVSDGSYSNGANIQVFAGNGSGAQVFRLTDEGNGLFSIQSCKSFKVLEARYGGTGEGTNVWQYDWNGTAAQLWVPVVDSSGRMTLLNAKSGKALTFSGSNVQLNAGRGAATQHWSLTPTSKYSLTGNSTLDRIVANVLSTHTSLWSAFKYVSYNFSYREGNRHWSGWSLSDSTSQSYAIEMYNYGSGNCYRFASLFAWLAYGLGYTNAYVRTGWVVGYSAPQAPHGWVVIDGYICDPDMQHEAPSRNWYWQTWESAPTAYYSW